MSPCTLVPILIRVPVGNSDCETNEFRFTKLNSVSYQLSRVDSKFVWIPTYPGKQNSRSRSDRSLNMSIPPVVAKSTNDCRHVSPIDEPGLLPESTHQPPHSSMMTSYEAGL